MANSSRVTTKASPSSKVAAMASSVIMPVLGEAFSLDGLARETICTSTGTASASLVVRAASSCVCSRSNSARLDFARLSSARNLTSSPPALTTRFLASSMRCLTPSSRRAATFGLALEAVDDLRHLGVGSAG